MTSPVRASRSSALSLHRAARRPAGGGRPETSRFPIERRARMPGSTDDAEPSGARGDAPERGAFCRLEGMGAPKVKSYAAQWLAYAYPCQRFACGLATAHA
jgi:hypothetical protein